VAVLFYDEVVLFDTMVVSLARITNPSNPIFICCYSLLYH